MNEAPMPQSGAITLEGPASVQQERANEGPIFSASDDNKKIQLKVLKVGNTVAALSGVSTLSANGATPHKKPDTTASKPPAVQDPDQDNLFLSEGTVEPVILGKSLLTKPNGNVGSLSNPSASAEIQQLQAVIARQRQQKAPDSPVIISQPAPPSLELRDDGSYNQPTKYRKLFGPAFGEYDPKAEREQPPSAQPESILIREGVPKRRVGMSEQVGITDLTEAEKRLLQPLLPSESTKRKVELMSSKDAIALQTTNKGPRKPRKPKPKESAGQGVKEGECTVTLCVLSF